MKKISFFLLVLTLFCFQKNCIAEELGTNVFYFDLKYLNLVQNKEEVKQTPVKITVIKHESKIKDTRDIAEYVLKNKQKDLQEKEEKERVNRQTALLEELILMSNPKISKKDKDEFIKSILKWSKFYNLEPIYVASVIHRESNFRNNYIFNE